MGRKKLYPILLFISIGNMSQYGGVPFHLKIHDTKGSTSYSLDNSVTLYMYVLSWYPIKYSSLWGFLSAGLPPVIIHFQNGRIQLLILWDTDNKYILVWTLFYFQLSMPEPCMDDKFVVSIQMYKNCIHLYVKPYLQLWYQLL